MRPIKEIRLDFNFFPTEITSSLKYFKQLNIDWD